MRWIDNKGENEYDRGGASRANDLDVDGLGEVGLAGEASTPTINVKVCEEECIIKPASEEVIELREIKDILQDILYVLQDLK